MDIVLLIVVVYALFKFSRVLTTVVKVVNTAANIADDTINTYGNEVHILNADKRKEQADTLNSMGDIVTAYDINLILRGTQNPVDSSGSK